MFGIILKLIIDSLVKLGDGPEEPRPVKGPLGRILALRLVDPPAEHLRDIDLKLAVRRRADCKHVYLVVIGVLLEEESDLSSEEELIGEVVGFRLSFGKAVAVAGKIQDLKVLRCRGLRLIDEDYPDLMRQGGELRTVNLGLSAMLSDYSDIVPVVKPERLERVNVHQ